MLLRNLQQPFIFGAATWSASTLNSFAVEANEEVATFSFASFLFVVRCGFSLIYSLPSSACTWRFFILSASLDSFELWLVVRHVIHRSCAHGVPRMQYFIIIARQICFPGNIVRKVEIRNAMRAKIREQRSAFFSLWGAFFSHRRDAVEAQLKCISNAFDLSAHSHYGNSWKVKGLVAIPLGRAFSFNFHRMHCKVQFAFGAFRYFG